VETVVVEESVGRYCIDLASATRRHQQVMVGASPRGSLALMLTARALAVLAGRDYVVPEDVKAVAEPALAHRITLRPELWLQDASGASVVRQVLASVPTPPTSRAAGAPLTGSATSPPTGLPAASPFAPPFG
nr:MoxR family ATPase [Actinomycetota bacterium]